MAELLNKISSNNLILLCVIMSIIALFLAIAISIELFNNYKRKKRIELLTGKTDEEVLLNIKEDENVTYVEDDEELEKTKARIELAKLKERLKQEEEEKKKLLEINLALANKENTVKQEEKVEKVEKVEEIKQEEPKKVEEVIIEKKEEIKQEAKETKQDVIEILDDEFEQQLRNMEQQEEEKAIISYEELKNAANFGYSDEEMSLYVDEKDAIISIQELENLYKESNEINTETTNMDFEQFNIKRVEDLPEISDDKKFQSTPFISPIHGVGITEESILLEQTANLEKLNEEIRKTNEFLKTLKELKKNLQ